MSSIKEILIALAILAGSNFAIHKIYNQVRFLALQKAAHGLYPMTHFTSKLTGIDPKRIEQGYFD
jgi:hypothetical protein